MLMNNLDPDVAERPDDLVVYGGSGRAARSWEAFDAIVHSLRALEHDETLVVQSGKPVAVFRTHPWAPRVVIANAMLVPAWATWETFRDLEDRGLTMYGQMTAGSWIYIGTQGILQGTYETLAEVARRHFGGSLRGTLTVTAGLGGMGGAQPLAVTLNEGVALVAQRELDNLVRTGRLKPEPPVPAEPEGLLRSGSRRLADAERTELSLESRFDLAYNAAHALALAALRAKGYRSESRYLVFQCLQHTADLPYEQWRVLDQAHRKRILAEYGGETDVDAQLVEALLRVTREIEQRVTKLSEHAARE
jgi:hypothetical protein